MGVFSVLIGLAVADIATSLHRLVRSKVPVTWDPLALLAAFYALCLAVTMWFDIWGVRNFASTRHFFFYLALVADLFLLFLIAAASLPDEPGADAHLGNYYASTRRYFWSLVTSFQIIYFVFGLYFVGGDLRRAPQELAARLLLQMGAPGLIALTLATVQSRVVHYVGLALMFLVMAAHYASLQIN